MRVSLELSQTDRYLQLFWIYNEEFNLVVLYKFMQSNLQIIKQLKHTSFLVGVLPYMLQEKIKSEKPIIFTKDFAQN